jgi:hypothetical protein
MKDTPDANAIVSEMKYQSSIEPDLHCELDVYLNAALGQLYIKVTVEDHSMNPDNDRTYVDYVPVSAEEVEALREEGGRDAALMIVDLSKGRRCITKNSGSHHFTQRFFNPFL